MQCLGSHSLSTTVDRHIYQNVLTATFADNMAVFASEEDSQEASAKLVIALNNVQLWLKE